MTSNTHVISAGDTFIITTTMNILQFSIIGLSLGTTFTYMGSQPMNDESGAAIPPAPITLSGMCIYNSKMCPNGANPWTGITISCTAGSVGIELLQN